MKFTLILIAMLLSNHVLAEGRWYEFNGFVSYTTGANQDLLSQFPIGTPVRYVVFIDNELSGFYYRGNRKITRRNRTSNEHVYSHYYYAEYACGNAADLAYYDHYYSIIEDKGTYSGQSTSLNVGQRLDLKSTAAYHDWSVGMTTLGVDLTKVNGANDSTATIKSDLTLSAIYDANPC